ncbi:hypothetical protein M5D96_006040 [Drosophila gunungcola]|uniref:SH3 domain-containing protein n=1 Tax=Drosophila gunungcola TaxID=103775 RepID=A0A9P9YRJ1_9MUSC|nr:hypothetical protein M5D96_006040 [Drosophila gunungcola]
MTLNMKTYKGYNKMPYCEAHIPKAKATAIADTPELKRIAENTKIQSNVKYHADFEKAKGKFTQVADDPETLRIKQNTKHISNVAYHGDLEKKAAMEKQRGSAEVSDSSSNSRVYRAIYDYEAQDVDEVSFREGDVIFEVESIDSGWMTGRVERTGKTGMLPANYVEQAVI